MFSYWRKDQLNIMKHDPESHGPILPDQEGRSQAESPASATAKNEDALLNSTTIKTSHVILETRERIYHELREAKKALEKKTAELNGSLSMLRAIMESTADGLFVTDKHGNVLYYNRIYMNMWPVPGKLMRRARHRLIIQYCSGQLRNPDEFMRLTREIYTTWPTESFDVLQFNDGRIFEQYTKTKILDGQDTGRVWSFRDITERRQADTYKAQLAAIVESSNDAIIVKDLNGIITNWNAGAEEIFGYRSSEIIGSSISVLVPPDRLEEEDRIMGRIKSGKSADHFETVRWGKGKKPINVSVTISPVKDSAGNIIGASKIARDITQRKESQERIEYLAHYDSLTGLPNRALLADRMKIAIGNASRYSFRLALLFVDLDRFKLVNDSLGHEIGDKLLKTVAKRMQSIVRRTDTVSRVGGDEFIVLLNHMQTAADAARAAEKLIAAVSQPYLIEQHELMLTASIGISIYPDSGKDASSMLRNADASMYSAKEYGRNCYRFYSEELTSLAADRLSLERDLRGALARGEIFPVYQPQIEFGTGRVTGAEALMRWRHPKRGLVLPADFIPIAEDSGLILSLGEYILRESCRQARQWHDRHGFDAVVAVNVSAVQFRQNDFTDAVSRVLAETGLLPERLELEVTESVVMQGVESAVQKMRVLDDSGIKIAIDDFGTGYSSLSYLRNFAVDRLKIDLSFVRDIPHHTDANAIVGAIVTMGRGLGSRVIAEGVETEAQAQFLQSVQCDEGQGYLYAKPMNATDFEAWLKTSNSGSI
ncbi:PAS domain S-box-containing protein/diguanylate cyclase (GGDEF) domain-containing protein [Nitrosospira briensis]|uniref:PAS domain S-box-containing protein/diguanylate cyclase (GGDEF) domain-containing protein n=2 Tax=Nitrosospira briensis TaxID=35799 RepID=A0A1I4Z9J5_9PROT|nr:PAS domain S-box-containing protein/diguanylate cyclase (GGDEF) domain-containing protein [Nitrosospira briensis]